jgi:hypothetical protein
MRARESGGVEESEGTERQRRSHASQGFLWGKRDRGELPVTRPFKTQRRPSLLASTGPYTFTMRIFVYCSFMYGE